MSRQNVMLTLIAITLFVTAACGSRHRRETAPAAVSQHAPAIQVIKGFAVYGHEVRTFRPCGQDDPLWAIDPSGLIWELHQDLALHLEPDEEVFAIVEGRLAPPPQEGFGTSYPATLEVKRVLYMAQEGFRCNIELGEFHYRAYGNEPFWAAWISSAGIVFKAPGREDRTWANIDEKPLDQGFLYTGTGPPGRIEIRIIDEPCSDSMSGAHFAYSARVTLDSEKFAGCALKGTGDPQN